MSFRQRILMMVGGALLLSLLGGGYAILALHTTRDNFTRFVEEDLLELQAFETMYAQGLQSGQALRNIVLDPGNKQGYANLNKALDEFSGALSQLSRAAAGDKSREALVAEIGRMAQKRRQTLDRVLGVVKEDRANAMALLNSEETPAWRELRKTLMDTIETRRKEAGVKRDQATQAADRATQIAVGLGIVSILLAIFMVERLVRHLWRELGGEPAEAARTMQRVAQGDLTVRIDGAPAGSLLDTLNGMVSALRSLVMEIEAQALRLNDGAAEINLASANLADGAQAESDSAVSMAAAIEEMSASIASISSGVGEASTDSAAAVDFAREGESRVVQASGKIALIAATVRDTSAKIRALDQRAVQISAIAGAIKDIAGQTNLLALNAAIEAARAGEQGRGFAVVADEVRKLAERTSSATVEIEGMITGIQHDTEAAVSAMDATLPQVEEGARLAEEASASLVAIHQGAGRTLVRVRSIAGATAEQSTASAQVASQVERVARMVRESSLVTRKTAQTAADLEKIAKTLRGQIERFRV